MTCDVGGGMCRECKSMNENSEWIKGGGGEKMNERIKKSDHQ